MAATNTDKYIRDLWFWFWAGHFQPLFFFHLSHRWIHSNGNCLNLHTCPVCTVHCFKTSTLAWCNGKETMMSLCHCEQVESLFPLDLFRYDTFSLQIWVWAFFGASPKFWFCVTIEVLIRLFFPPLRRFIQVSSSLNWLVGVDKCYLWKLVHAPLFSTCVGTHKKSNSTVHQRYCLVCFALTWAHRNLV